MAEYIKENKAHLAELVAFESEGYTTCINFDDPAAPKHDAVLFEEEPEEDQKALNDVLHENFCLRLRCVGLGEETPFLFSTVSWDSPQAMSSPETNLIEQLLIPPLLRCQCIKLAKTQGWEKLWPSGTEIPMKMYGKYMFIVTFP
jgi:hypothetical protein